MWLPSQMTLPIHDQTFFKLGAGMPAAQLSDPLAAPLGAIISLGGYCTASFVSADGLLVTNHHCAQRGLDFNSTPDKNLVESGFLAKTRGDELFAGPGQKLYIAQAFTVESMLLIALIVLPEPTGPTW